MKKRNPIAKALRNPLFRKQVIPNMKKRIKEKLEKAEARREMDLKED